jgi:hypothetical protein
MNTFDKARLKHEKNKERQGRAPQEVLETPKEKEAPKVEAKVVEKRDGPLVFKVSGPFNLEFEVDYVGSLIASQQTPSAIKELLTKQLTALGRVRWQHS